MLRNPRVAQGIRIVADIGSEIRVGAPRCRPEILFGHSLGGAAVLAAAGDIPECKAVVTIGAPFEPGHVLKALGSSLEDVRKNGSSQVRLAGRSFLISQGFVEDISAANLRDAISSLRRALLVLHSPIDQTVGVENAADIFIAARHPKSFVSLDNADHLLTRKEDAEYAATVIAAWVSRYVTNAETRKPDAAHPEGVVRVVEAEAKGMLQRISVEGKFHLLADEPRSVGGSDLGPTPYQLLSAALGACTSITLRMYASRKGLSIDSLTVDVTHSKSHAADSENQETASKIDHFVRTIAIDGEVSEEQRASLLRIADLCPVHKTLEGKAQISTKLVSRPD